MPSPFDTLSQEQKDAFNSRLKQQGFDPTALAGGHILTSGDGCRIHDADPQYAKYVKYKTISSIDEVKQVLGVPNAAFAKSGSDDHLKSKYLPPPPYAGKSDVTLSALTPEEENDLDEVTYAYLFGNSDKVAGWADVINRLKLPRELGFVAAESVTVKPGSPLYITYPSYTFGVMTIEPGGQVIVQSDSSVSIQRLVKGP